MKLRGKSASVLLFALAFAAGVPAWQSAYTADLKPTGLPVFQTLELKILSANGRQTIGSTSFAVSSDGWNETIKGETRYLDGQRDNEVERLLWLNGRFRLELYEHYFFGADGAITMFDKLDPQSHIASCSRREGDAMKVRTSRFDFPADTFGGGSQLLMAMDSLRQGSREIDFHAFACIPGPRVFQVEVAVPQRTQRWPLYPGNLIRLDLRPDLGAGLNLIITPFLPKTAAWFDPHDNWKYVGGEFNRYFGGPHVYQVLLPTPR